MHRAYWSCIFMDTLLALVHVFLVACLKCGWNATLCVFWVVLPKFGSVRAILIFCRTVNRTAVKSRFGSEVVRFAVRTTLYFFRRQKTLYYKIKKQIKIFSILIYFKTLFISISHRVFDCFWLFERPKNADGARRLRGDCQCLVRWPGWRGQKSDIQGPEPVWTW